MARLAVFVGGLNFDFDGVFVFPAVQKKQVGFGDFMGFLYMLFIPYHPCMAYLPTFIVGFLW